MMKNIHNSPELKPFLRVPKNPHARPILSFLKTEFKKSAQSDFSYSGEQNNGHNTAKQITGTMTHNQITGSETKRPFVLNKELSQDSNLLVMMKNFYNMHDVYFMNILKAVFRNTARFIPDFPMVEDNFYEHISYIIYTRYHLFITYMQIVVSYDGEFVYFPPNGVWKISNTQFLSRLVTYYGLEKGSEIYSAFNNC